MVMSFCSVLCGHSIEALLWSNKEKKAVLHLSSLVGVEHTCSVLNSLESRSPPLRHLSMDCLLTFADLVTMLHYLGYSCVPLIHHPRPIHRHNISTSVCSCSA